METYPTLHQVVLDTRDARELAEFYRQMFGLSYREGDEIPADGSPDERGRDWLVLRNPGGISLAFQQTTGVTPSTWPDGTIPQQFHLDTTVPDTETLDAQHERALALGAKLLFDRRDDPHEPLRVYADPAGHPFCVFVG
jgi:catechol 2,3-dioxygenase-like lactoylglutathione lyase family enzyme